MTRPPGRCPLWLTDRPIAHRGLHSLPAAPENSLESFGQAINAGFPIELDVRLLSDGGVVVFHDADLERMTGRRGPIAQQTAAGLQPLRLLSTDARIPLLQDVLALVNGQVPLLVEIKNDADRVGGLEQATLDLLAGYAGPAAVQSFNPASLSYIRAHAPHAVRGQLSGGFRRPPPGRLIRFARRHLLFNGLSRPDFIAYEITALPNLITRVLRARGLPLIAWTIRTPAQQRKAQQVADNYIFEDLRP